MSTNDAGLYGSNTAANIGVTTLAEFVGTYVLVLFGTTAATVALLKGAIAGGAYDSLTVALAFGLALLAMAGALGHVSGAHFNPAVTIGLVVSGRHPLNLTALTYLLGQVAGGVAASYTLAALVGPAGIKTGLGLTQPSEGIPPYSTVIAEAIGVAVLMFVIISVATDKRVPKAVATLTIGFTLSVCILFAGYFTGAGLNPARVLGPMVVTGQYRYWYIYVGAEVAGAVVGALSYRFIFGKAQPPTP